MITCTLSCRRQHGKPIHVTEPPVQKTFCFVSILAHRKSQYIELEIKVSKCRIYQRKIHLTYKSIPMLLNIFHTVPSIFYEIIFFTFISKLQQMQLRQFSIALLRIIQLQCKPHHRRNQ